MLGKLAEIVAHKQEEIRREKQKLSLDMLNTVQSGARQGFLEALRLPGIHLITEFKPKSPSAGDLAPAMDETAVLEAYEPYASGLSVLVDEKYFGGSWERLGRIAQQSHRPVLCKEFVLDPFQLEKAQRSGAKAALLIVKILDNPQLADLYQASQAMGLDPVVEINDEAELERAMALHPKLLLINNRNLATFEIDLSTTARLACQIPQDVLIISASGIESPGDMQPILPYTQRFLIGSALMRQPNPQALLKSLKEVPLGELA